MIFNNINTTRSSRDITTLHYATVKAYHHTSGGTQKLWAVATDNKNNIIAEAGNQYKITHPLQFHYAKQCGCEYRDTLHAEINVVAQLRRIRKKASKLFIARAGYM